jgi:ribosomal protein S12
MKTIIMEQTFNLIATQNPEYAKILIQTGKVKELDGLKYLVIEQKEENEQ